MEFEPSSFLSDNGKQYRDKRSLIILNQPIHSFNRLALIWKNTSYQLCADGGANRLHDLISVSRAEGDEDYYVCFFMV
jgi:thiamine pyrophosphokinase